MYWHWLALASLFFLLAEWLYPWHRPHPIRRPGWLRDLGYWDWPFQVRVSDLSQGSRALGDTIRALIERTAALHDRGFLFELKRGQLIIRAEGRLVEEVDLTNFTRCCYQLAGHFMTS